MMQWGPDTSPHRAAGGGYTFGDTELVRPQPHAPERSGLPGARRRPDPADGRPDHRARPRRRPRASRTRREHAAPGRYSVTLGELGIGVDLAVTTRTGIARDHVPRDRRSANLLFKVADSAVPGTAAHAQVVGDREIAGSVESGHFCDTTGHVHARRSTRSSTGRSARFAHVAVARRIRSGARGGRRRALRRDVTFDTRANRTVTMKVGISFVSVANARANLAAENPGWNVDTSRVPRRSRWDDDARPHRRRRRHAPKTRRRSTRRSTARCCTRTCSATPTVSTAGFDGRVTRPRRGYTQYANFSGLGHLPLGDPAARDARAAPRRAT